MEYVGPTGVSFRIRFSEHFRGFKYANNKPKFAQYLLENNHSIGPMDNIMKVLYEYSTNKGKLMDTMERFCIYEGSRDNNRINDNNTVKRNVIFDTLVLEEASRARTNR